MLDGQGSRPDFRCSQGVKHENFLGQDLDRSRGWKYTRLCSVPPLRKSSNYSAKKFNSNLQLALLLEPKDTSKVASGA